MGKLTLHITEITKRSYTTRRGESKEEALAVGTCNVLRCQFVAVKLEMLDKKAAVVGAVVEIPVPARVAVGFDGIAKLMY